MEAGEIVCGVIYKDMQCAESCDFPLGPTLHVTTAELACDGWRAFAKPTCCPVQGCSQAQRQKQADKDPKTVAQTHSPLFLAPLCGTWSMAAVAGASGWSACRSLTRAEHDVLLERMMREWLEPWEIYCLLLSVEALQLPVTDGNVSQPTSAWPAAQQRQKATARQSAVLRLPARRWASGFVPRFI